MLAIRPMVTSESKGSGTSEGRLYPRQGPSQQKSEFCSRIRNKVPSGAGTVCDFRTPFSSVVGC